MAEAPAHPGGAGGESAAPGGAAPAPLTVLAVDDDADVLRATARILAEAGFHVLTGATAAEALELTRLHRPALVLLDVMLPDGNGVDVARQIKGDPALADVFVILYSGSRISSDDQAKGLSEGLADGYMTRPLSKPELLARIDAFLRIRETQRALRESERKYRDVVERANDGIAILQGGVAVLANEAMARMSGFSVDELEGLSFLAVVQGEQHPQIAERVRRRLAGEEAPGAYEIDLVRKDGTRFTAEVSASLVSHAGAPADLVLVRDITARKQAEAALRESEERYRQLFESASDAVFVVAMDTTRIIDANSMASALYGYDHDELLTMKTTDVSAEPDETSRRAHEAQNTPDQVLTIPRRLHRKKDGAVFPVEITARNITWGKRPVLLVACRDVTERTRAEEESLVKDRAIESAINAVAISDLAGNLNYVNPAFLKLWGYGSAADVLGRSATTFWQMGGAAAEVQEALRAQGGWTGELVGRRKDGAPFDAQVAASLVVDAGGQPIRMLASFADITERKAAEEDVKRQRGILQSILDSIPVMVTYFDANGNIAMVSREVVAALGWTFEEWQTENILAHCYPEPEVFKEVLEFMVSGSTKWKDFKTTTRHGTVIDTAWTNISLPDGVSMGIGQDVTERKRAEDEIRRQAEQMRRTVEGAVLAMSNVVETRDPYTAGHERRVSALATAIAVDMGMEGEALTALRLAALIHDIGKIAVPAEILAKPGRLSEIEFNLIKQHPRAGFDILAAIDFGLPVAEMVLQHHERLDGSGYPNGLSGEDVLPEARILAVADVVEAMSSHRPYRPALGMAAALAEVRAHAGVKYDADVVATCVRLVEEQGFAFTP